MRFIMSVDYFNNFIGYEGVTSGIWMNPIQRKQNSIEVTYSPKIISSIDLAISCSQAIDQLTQYIIHIGYCQPFCLCNTMDDLVKLHGGLTDFLLFRRD